MIRSIKSLFLGIFMILIISLILPGCYTQLSRPGVDTDDEYYQEYSEESEGVDEYYQDEGTPPAEDSRDIYIYNNYPLYWNDYYYDDWYYSPYSWGYMGPYPYNWWDPYGHLWAPGWYVGYSYSDYLWGGRSPYYNPYYGYGYGYSTPKTKRIFDKRPFARRSIRDIDRASRTDSQTSLTKPITPTRTERPGRPGQTLATPIRGKSLSTPKNQRSIKEMVNNRLKARSRTPIKVVDDGRSRRTLTKKRPIVNKPAKKTIKSYPRSSTSTKNPRIINRAPSRSRSSTSKKGYSAPRKSSRSYSTPSRSRSSSSGSRVSRPSSGSSVSRGIGRSSSSGSSSKGSRSSRSSGSSKSSGKSGKK